jgi:hypothetical protein
MIGEEDAAYTYEYPDHFKILPAIHGWSEDVQRIGLGKPVGEGFSYTSDNNSEWMSIEDLQSWIKLNHSMIGKI